MAFTPYATMKDALGIGVFLILYAWFVFYIPNYLGHADNYIPANPAVTPAHIVPEWYYLPFYAILRSIPSKLIGVMALFGSIAILAFLPWLDTSKVRSATYRPLYRQFFWIFVAVCIGLGWLGSKPAEGGYVLAARVLTAWYFLHFIVVLPLLGLVEKPKPLPNSISEAVLKHRKCDRRRGGVPRRRGAGAWRTDAGFGPGARAADPAGQQVVVRRRVRPLRSRPAAARVQGLSERLPGLPRPSNTWRNALRFFFCVWLSRLARRFPTARISHACQPPARQFRRIVCGTNLNDLRTDSSRLEP